MNSVKCGVVKVVHSAPGHSQKRELSPGSAACYILENHKLKYVKSVSCVTQLSCVQPVTNVQNAAQNLPAGARLQNFWQTWLDLGTGPKVVQILKEGYTLPFRTRPNLKVPHSRKLLCQSSQEQLPVGGITSAYRQKCSRTGVFQPTVFGSKAQQQVETYIRSEQTESFPQGGEIQNGDTGNHQDIPPTRGVGRLNRFQGRLLPYTDTGTVQEISQISCPGSDLPDQSSAFRSVHITLGVHCSSKRGEIDGHTQGYKDPPVPRRLVGEGQIPTGLSPAYSGSSENMPRTRLDGQFGKVRTGTQADLRFCRLPVQPQARWGPTDTGLLVEPSRPNNRNTVTTGLSGPAVHDPDRFVNSHREASSSRLTTQQTHTVASQKQLEGTRITRKGDSNSQVPAPPLTMVATGRPHSHRPTITPNKACSANLYRCIKRRVGRHTWLLEPQQSRSWASLRQWQQELRLLRGDQPD